MIKIQQTYTLLASGGYLLLFGGLPFSKFLVTLGLILLIIAALIGIKIALKRPQVSVFQPFILIVAVFMSLVFSVLLSADKSAGLSQLIVQNGLLTLPLLTYYHWQLFTKKIHLFIKILITSSVIASVLICILFVLPIPTVKSIITEFSFLRPYEDHINRTQFGLYSPFIDRLHFSYIIGFASLLSFYYFAKSLRFKWLISSMFLVFTIALLGARGAQIALLIAAVPMMLSLVKHQIPELKIISFRSLILVSIILIAVPRIAYDLIPSVQNRYNQLQWEIDLIRADTYRDYDYQHFTTLTRLKSFEYTWEVIKSNPIMGTGIGDLHADLTKIYQEKSPDIPMHHQNYYLYIWACGGIASLILFLAFLVLWMRTFWRSSNDILLRGVAVGYWLFVVIILMVDVVMKYHLGVFSIPLFMLSIYALANVNEETFGGIPPKVLN